MPGTCDGAGWLSGGVQKLQSFVLLLLKEFSCALKTTAGLSFDAEMFYHCCRNNIAVNLLILKKCDAAAN